MNYRYYVCLLFFFPESCEHGVNRLVNGCDDAEGIVEICDRGVLRTVCGGDTWTNENAQVLCSELGFSREGNESHLYCMDVVLELERIGNSCLCTNPSHDKGPSE